MKHAIFFVLLLMITASCGEIPADADPVVLGSGPITGITLTTPDNIILGEFGTPSKGGDADGKERSDINCLQGTPPGSGGQFDIPERFRLGNAYPNPMDQVFNIGIELPCRMDVKMWAVIPPDQNITHAPVLGHNTVILNKGRILWSTEQTLNSGHHTLRVSNLDDPGGFMRIYFKGGGVLAWRDVGFFNDPCLIPPPLNGMNGLSRDYCGKI